MVDEKGFLRTLPSSSQTGIAKERNSGGENEEDPGESSQSIEGRTGSPISGISVEGLDRIEVQLVGGKKAYIFVPVPLPSKEKERLKKYIDLILDEES